MTMKQTTENFEKKMQVIINAPAKPNIPALIFAMYVALTIWINIFPEWSTNWMLNGLVF